MCMALHVSAVVEIYHWLVASFTQVHKTAVEIQVLSMKSLIFIVPWFQSTCFSLKPDIDIGPVFREIRGAKVMRSSYLRVGE